ncbi:hypothetical protein CIL07_07685 [Lacticaseibacillus paracasei subsp. paracasei]|uniref:hypothetical protein n=1 Tax=Lacticaseibacillus paracasei TaxID=1597 RepID=UPI003557FECE
MEKISMNSLMDSAILTSNDLQNTVGGYLYPQDGGGGSFSLSDLPEPQTTPYYGDAYLDCNNKVTT